MQDAGPGIKHRHACFNELAGVARNHNQIVERRNGSDEQIWLSEGVTAPLPVYDHCFPTKDNVLRDRQDSPSKQRAQDAVEPQMNVSSAARVRQLLNAKPDLGESDLRGEEGFGAFTAEGAEKLARPLQIRKLFTTALSPGLRFLWIGIRTRDLFPKAVFDQFVT